MQRKLLELTQERSDEAKKLKRTMEKANETIKNVETAALVNMKEMVKTIRHGVGLKEKEIDGKIELAKTRIEAHVKIFKSETNEMFEDILSEMKESFTSSLSEHFMKVDTTADKVDNNLRILLWNVQSQVFGLLDTVGSNVTSLWSRVLNKANLGGSMDEGRERQLGRKQIALQASIKQFLVEVVEAASNLDIDVEGLGDLKGEKVVRPGNGGKLSGRIAKKEHYDDDWNGVFDDHGGNDEELEDDFDVETELENVEPTDIELREAEEAESKRMVELDDWIEGGWDRIKFLGDEMIWFAVRCEQGEDCRKPDWVDDKFWFAYQPETYMDKQYPGIVTIDKWDKRNHKWVNMIMD